MTKICPLRLTEDQPWGEDVEEVEAVTDQEWDEISAPEPELTAVDGLPSVEDGAFAGVPSSTLNVLALDFFLVF